MSYRHHGAQRAHRHDPGRDRRTSALTHRRGRAVALVALTLLVPACCSRRPDPTATGRAASAASAPFAPEVSAARTTDWIAVPGRSPTRRGGSFYFHPSLPLVGQPGDEGECNVWDMALTTYRGAIESRICEAWEAPPRPVPSSLVAQFLGATAPSASAEPPRAPGAPAPVEARPGPFSSATARPLPQVPGAPAVSHPGPVAVPPSVPTNLVSAWHPDGRRLALGQVGGHQVKILDTRTHALLRTIDLPSKPSGWQEPPEPAELDSLAWTPAGDLAIAGFPFGAVVWSAREPGAPVTPLSRPHMQDGAFPVVDTLSLDPHGRYLGYTFFRGGTGGNYFEGAGIVSLADESKSIDATHVHEASDDSEKSATDAPIARPSGWSSTGEVVHGLYTSPLDPMHPDRPRYALAVFDARHHRAAWVTPIQDQHLDLALSPDGSLAVWVDRSGNEPPDGSRAEHPDTTSMHLWHLGHDCCFVAWSVKARPDVITWAPGSKHIATVSGEQVTVYSATDGKVRTQWTGHGPLAWSPAGDQLAFRDTAGAMVVHGLDAEPPRLRMNKAHTVMWTPGGLFAMVTDAAVTLLDAGSWKTVRTVDLPGVTRLWFDAPHGRFLLLDRQHTMHASDATRTERVASIEAEPTVHLTPAGEVLLVESRRLRRFTRGASGWSEQPSVRLEENEMVDPSGRVVVTLQERRTRMRRLSDGETLNFDGRAAWTDRHAYESTPGPANDPWVFRRGDVLTGRLVVGAEAAALAPHVPDLWAAFWSGKPLPGL